MDLLSCHIIVCVPFFLSLKPTLNLTKDGGGLAVLSTQNAIFFHFERHLTCGSTPSECARHHQHAPTPTPPPTVLSRLVVVVFFVRRARERRPRRLREREREIRRLKSAIIPNNTEHFIDKRG